MTSQYTHLWHRLLFKLKIYSSSGEQFQDLVNFLYRKTEHDFQSVRPWGKWGDRGNDGWIPTAGHYLQVHGPKPNSNLNAKSIADKTRDDFNKLIMEYQDIRKYSFILNDRYQGIPGPVVSSMQYLQREYELEACRVVGAEDLEKLFLTLPIDEQIEFCGGLPPDAPDYIDDRAVGELLRFLADRRSPMVMLSSQHAPDFNEKLIFNGLCDEISQYLRTFSYHTSSVSDFFARSPGDQQAIAEELRTLYNESKKAVPDSDANYSDLRYVWMVEQLIPDSMRNHQHSYTAYQTAAQVVLATYFETCDLYDDPTRPSST